MPSAKRIAIFIDSLGGGGAEKVMLTLTKGVLSQQHKVDFFLLENRIEYSQTNDFDIHVLYQNKNHRKSTNSWHLKDTANDMKQLVQQVIREKGEFDLHLVNLDPTSRVIELCNFKNTYYILHNAMKQELKREAKLGPFKYFRKLREKKTYNNKDIIAVSEGVKLEALSRKYIKPKSVIRIFNPTDIGLIKSLSTEPNKDIPSEPFLIHAGRVVKQKRHDILFKALALIPNIKLVLLCKYDVKARKLAAKYGVEDRIITPGFQENPYNWFKQASLLVSSSDFEGLGMNLIDALICGTPVVSTNCDYGPSEILTGELSKYLVPTGDYQALANKVQDVLKNPPTIDLNSLEDNFAVETAVQQYLNLITTSSN